tara:strand:- start:42 stop:527 length:486 start_codon:yes stop_codon:yes gene_type:complete
VKTVIQDNFLSTEQCIWLIKQYENVSKPIEQFDSFYPWNHGYKGKDSIGNSPLWLIDKINNLATEINGSVVDWIETVKWYAPCPGKRLHSDDVSNKTTLSCVIYLNSDYTGGQTYFEDGTVINPVSGRALFFDGKYHKHGVTNVDHGIRFNISCWLKKKIV